VKNDAGIRKLPGTALVNDTTDEVIYTPPSGEDIILTLMTNFVEYLNNDERSLTKLAVLHYQFESIHPFMMGTEEPAESLIFSICFLKVISILPFYTSVLILLK